MYALGPVLGVIALVIAIGTLWFVNILIGKIDNNAAEKALFEVKKMMRTIDERDKIIDVMRKKILHHDEAMKALSTAVLRDNEAAAPDTQAQKEGDE